MEKHLTPAEIILVPADDLAVRRRSFSAIRGRLTSIDALRGVAALVVTIGHGFSTDSALLTAYLSSASGAILWLLMPVFRYGYTGVFLFFIISGFCIHMRWAKAAALGEQPEVDFNSFWKRRIRRLYPAYLVVLALYLAIGLWQGHLRADWFTAYDTVMHLLMLHNLDIRTCYSINGVFWTLAIEEQLYLAYFLLLAMRRRLSWQWMLAITFACRVGWFGLCFVAHRWLGWEIPAYEAAFSNWCVWTLGAVCVEARYGAIKLPPRYYSLWWGGLFLLSAAVTDYVDRSADPHGLLHKFIWLVNTPLWGIGFFFVVNRFTAAEADWAGRRQAPRLVTWAAALGVFSYSLYLTHELVLTYPGKALGNWLGLSENAGIVLGWVLLCPASILFARVFFEFFEKPFLNSPTQGIVINQVAKADSLWLR
ncbi:MAG: acyltransferase [Acidobacteriota bacterium]